MPIRNEEKTNFRKISPVGVSELFFVWFFSSEILKVEEWEALSTLQRLVL